MAHHRLNLRGPHVEGYSVALRVFLCVCEGKTTAPAGRRNRGPGETVSKPERERVGGWHGDPCPGSLGLLPSGPDPVGEWLVHHQPPGFALGN
jgi:hypothetical protein